MSNVNNNAEHNVNEVNNEKAAGLETGSAFGNPKLRKSLRFYGITPNW